jgi:uncharacterized membrane protein
MKVLALIFIAFVAATIFALGLWALWRIGAGMIAAFRKETSCNDLQSKSGVKLKT